MSNLKALNNHIKLCKQCRLHKTRKNAIIGEGPLPSRFMFIAQAPGRNEDRYNKILIGPSGDIFNTLLQSVNITRDHTYITNLLKCFLPNCRKPRKDEIETCFGLHLVKEIEEVKPEIIITLGYHVTKFIFKLYDLKVPNRIEFKSTFGKLFIAKNTKIVPLHHPATVVHKSKKIDVLKSEYNILRTLQSPCRFIPFCTKYLRYKKGLEPINQVERFCYGNWIQCSYFQRYTKNEFLSSD